MEGQDAAEVDAEVNLVQLPGAGTAGSPAAAIGTPLSLSDEGTPLVDLDGGIPDKSAGVRVESRNLTASRGLSGECCRSRTRAVS